VRRLALIAAAGLAVALPATNAFGGASGPEKPAGKSCPDGNLCLWADENYEGQKVKIHGKGLSNQLYKEMNDNAESLKLRREGGAVLYTNTDGDSVSFCVTHGPTNFNDLFEGSNDASSTRISKKPVPSECKNPKAGHGAKSHSSCPDEALCVWSKKNYEGQRVKITKTGDVSNKLAHEMNNKASSLKNRFAMTGTLYDKKNGGSGEVYGFCDLDNVPDLGLFDDLASSSVVNASSWRARRVCRQKAANKAGTNKVCPRKALCVWDKPKYKGQRVVVKTVGQLSTKIAQKMDDKTSSAKSRWKHTAYLYEDSDGGGQAFCVEPKVPDFADFSDPFDNEASSALLPDEQINCT
jgi:hypothetical protein